MNEDITQSTSIPQEPDTNTAISVTPDSSSVEAPTQSDQPSTEQITQEFLKISPKDPSTAIEMLETYKAQGLLTPEQAEQIKNTPIK
jgi:hypothetical protein